MDFDVVIHATTPLTFQVVENTSLKTACHPHSRFESPAASGVTRQLETTESVNSYILLGFTLCGISGGIVGFVLGWIVAR
jgi:hypothetical protein